MSDPTHEARVAGFRAQLARRAEKREADYQRVIDSVTTRDERSPQERAARLAELERRIAALPVDLPAGDAA